MIFKNTLYKIVSGTNIALKPISTTKSHLFIFNSALKIYTIDKTNMRCTYDKSLNYNAVLPINDNYLAMCYDDNVMVKNETL
ncbi:MAG: hypothetical protein IJ538_02155 [Clostridia bacterium]|nr:hypothetical protein [Clostridia bacterium]